MSSEQLIKHDKGKVRYDLVDPVFHRGIAEVMTYGANKYQAYNWIKPIDDMGRLWSALQRHIEAIKFGDYTDSESGLRHAWHAGCNIQFIDYHIRQGVSPIPKTISSDSNLGAWF